MKQRLLLVEDDPHLARAMARLLRRGPYEVFVAANCAEARNAQGDFSAAVYDVELPDGDGIALAAELEISGKVRRTIFYTGAVDPTLIERARAIGPLVDKTRGVAALRMMIEATLNRAKQMVASGEQPGRPSSSAPPPSGVRRNGR